MKLILHIGTAKTGTTTLQHWFASNRESLQVQGIYYPKSLGKVNHRQLSLFAINRVTPDPYFQKKNISSAQDYQLFKSHLSQDFEKEYKQHSNLKNWVISNEHLHSRLSQIEMVKQVKQFLSDKFEEIEILVHLRPQIDIAVSLASTAARAGKTVNSSWFSKQKQSSHYYNYDQLIEKWETIFGADQVTILPFKRSPCMTSFLIQSLGIKDNFTDIQRKNEAVDWRTMALSNIILNSEIAKEERITYKMLINDLPFAEKLAIGLDMAKEFQSHFDHSNTQLIHRRPDLNSDDLTPDWSRYDEPANLHHLDHSPVFAEQLNALIFRFYWETQLEKCNTKLAECERALAQNHLKEGRQFLKQARKIVSQVPKHEKINSHLEQVEKRIVKLAEKLQ